MFWTKKTEDLGKKDINTDEYVKCLKRMAEIDSRVESLFNKFNLLQTDMENLRGRFNQKLKSFAEAKPEAETKDLNSDNTIYLG
jgi:DNA anti-recombination protein RmuC